MHRLHDDDLKHLFKPEYWGYIRKTLEQLGAVVVFPDEVSTSDNFMPGCAKRHRGRFGVTEPWPPYDPERQIIEEAQRNKKAAPLSQDGLQTR